MSFVDDLKVFERITDEQAEKIVVFLNGSEKASSRYLTENKPLFETLSLDEKSGKAIFRVLLFLTDVAIEEKGIDDGFKEVENNFKDFFGDDSRIISSWDKAKSILRQLERFSLNRKELLLKTKFPHLHDFSLICDARPIFNSSRDEIIKFTYPVLMKIKDQENKDFVFEMNEDNLKRISREIQFALKKIDTLKKSFASTNKK